MKEIILGACLIFLMPAAAAHAAPAAAGVEKSESTEPQAVPEVLVPARIPLFSPLFLRFPAATVDGDPITVKELTEALARAHEGKEGEAAAGRKDYQDMLTRLVNVRLIVREAKNMGFDELPDVRSAVDAFGRKTLRQQFMDQYVKDVKIDDAVVEKTYRELVTEYKIRAMLFDRKELARKVRAEIKNWADFDAAASRLLESKQAKVDREGIYLKRDGIFPEVYKKISSLTAGSVTPVIPVNAGFAITKVEDVRVTEDPAAKEQARQEALDRERARVLSAYKNALIKKYVKLNARLFKGLDYESKKPGIKELSRDRRVLAEIAGEKPVTVADLTEALMEKFYHGIEEAVESKEVNKEKFTALDGIIHKRIFTKEALRHGIDKTEEYRDALKEFNDSVLFSAFVQKVVAPEVKVEEAEMKAYYEERRADYSSPETVRLTSLAFKTRKAAEEALGKLRKGTDFQWVKSNAEGQTENADKLIPDDGQPVPVTRLPEALQKTVTGARSGEFKLFEKADGPAYVVFIQDLAPPRPQPFETVKEVVQKMVFAGKLKTMLEEWAGKLRAVYPVKMYITGVDK